MSVLSLTIKHTGSINKFIRFHIKPWWKHTCIVNNNISQRRRFISEIPTVLSHRKHSSCNRWGSGSIRCHFRICNLNNRGYRNIRKRIYAINCLYHRR